MAMRKKATGWLIGAVCLAVCAILYVVSAILFSGDWVRLALSVAAAIGFGVGAFGFYLQWAKEQRKARKLSEDTGPH